MLLPNIHQSVGTSPLTRPRLASAGPDVVSLLTPLHPSASNPTRPTNRDICFSPGNGDCNAIESAPPVLLASSCALLALSLISALLLAVGIKIKYLGGGVTVEEEMARPNPLKTPSRTTFPEPSEPREKQHRREQHDDEGKYHARGQEPVRSLGGAGRVVGAEYKAEQKEEGVAERKEVLTGAEPWAVGYVNRLAGGGNKKRRDEHNSQDRGGHSSGGVGGGGGFDSGGTDVLSQ